MTTSEIFEFYVSTLHIPYVLKILRFSLCFATSYFQDSPPYELLPCFHVTITGNFERFKFFIFDANFLKNENLFQKGGLLFFSLKY